MATGTIDGQVLLHEFDAPDVKLRHRLKAHKNASSCRAIRFSLSRDLILAASEDGSILAVDVETGKARARKIEAHDTSISRLATVSETVMASGDDEGVIKLWDSRKADPMYVLEAHDSYVSDMLYHSAENTLLSVSGDGTLAVTDVRKGKVIAHSEEDADDELLSVALLKGGKKIACGTTTGVVALWSWGYWNDCSDRFPGHPESVTSLIAWDEDTLISASGDGLIRVLSVQPNRMLGVLGEHGDLDVERLAMDSAKKYLASASHDDSVKIWNLGVLQDDDDEDDEVEDDDVRGEEVATLEKNVGMCGTRSSSSSSSDDEGDSPAQKQRKKRRRGEHKIPRKSQVDDSSFFADIL